MATPAASAQEMSDMVVTLIAQVKELQTRLGAAEVTLAARGDFGGGGGRDREDGDLVKREFFLPEKFASQRQIFKEWAEEFMDFVKSRDSRLAELLDGSARWETPITNHGDDEKKSRVLYRVLKKLVTHAEAKQLVVHATDGNVFEAWRQLHARYDPQNDASATRMLNYIMKVENWKCKNIGDVPVTLARWEGLQREHKVRTGEAALSSSMARNLLMEIVPPAMREHIRTQTMLFKRKDLTYDTLRMYILDCAHELAHVPTPMDVSAFDHANAAGYQGGVLPNYGQEPPFTNPFGEPAPEATAPKEWPGSEPVDSFSKYPKGGGVGKGEKGKGDKGGKQQDHRDKTCDTCGRKGHIKIYCWFNYEVDPKTEK